MHAYVAFVLNNRRLLGFGAALTFFSSFGQTYFISLSNDGIRASFDLSHGQYGLVYSLATLASGLTILHVGRLIDHADLQRYTITVCAGLIAACFLVALSPWIITLAIGLFLLRLCGQGLMGHTAMTAMARYFDARRGTAMSLAQLGYPAGEALFPIVGVALIATLGWRGGWLAIGCGLALILLPLVLTLLRGQRERHAVYLASLDQVRTNQPRTGTHRDDDSTDDDRTPRQWTRRDVLHDHRFFMIIPAALAPAFIVTGLLFHQQHLVDSKGWAMTWFAACFVGFAATQLPASLTSGVLIDRIGARRLLPFFLLPLTLATLTLALFTHPAAALAFLMLAGLTSGVIGNILGALWAELYGVLHFGSIRALVTSLMVISTSLSPFALGWLIDRGVTMEAIAGGCAVYLVIASIIAAIGVNLPARGDPARA